MTPKTFTSPVFGRRANRGFTLVEMFIVGALIALFSALAIFGVQQQFNSNLKKATIGEARNIGTALSFANLDTNVFPRLCWLNQSTPGMEFLSLLSDNNSRLRTFQALDILGRPTTVQLNGARLRNLWHGPYFSSSQSRSGISQGRGGSVQMTLPEFSGTSNDTFEWPADPYNNPYVVYMLDINTDDPANPKIQFVNDRNPNDLALKGNYVNAVVSYGRNQAPGGLEDSRVTADAGNLNTVGQGIWRLRLYNGAPATRNYRMLEGDDYLSTGGTDGALAEDRAAIWTLRFAGINGGGLNVGGTGNYPADENGRLVGIADLGSDDIVYEF